MATPAASTAVKLGSQESAREDEELDTRSAAAQERWGTRPTPPPLHVWGAIARGRRLIEGLRGLVDGLEGGTVGDAEAKAHGRIAQNIDRMWELYMRRTDLPQEAALRYLEAVELSLASRPHMRIEQRVSYVREVLGACFPEYVARVDAGVVELTVRGFTGLEKKFPTLFDAVERVVQRGVYKNVESLRIAYGKWLKASGWKGQGMLTRDRVAEDVERADDDE